MVFGCFDSYKIDYGLESACVRDVAEHRGKAKVHGLPGNLYQDECELARLVRPSRSTSQ